MHSNNMMLFAGNASRSLAAEISKSLQIPLGRIAIGRFSDGETTVEILENVRGRDVFIVQSTSAPANDHLMELLVMADALRRASAARITAVIPYFGYARQDRRVRSARVAITAKVVADMLSTVGISRVLTVDLHADQIQGFFYIPVDNIYATPVILEDIQKKALSPVIVVSPDVGGVVRARAIAKLLNDAELAIIDKRRPAPNQAQVMNIIGDVKNKNCLIVDDIVDTASTLCSAAVSLKEQGAAGVFAYCTHPVLSGKALENIANSPLDELVVTDTIALTPASLALPNIRQLSLSHLLAKAIHRISASESISSMFE